LDLGLPKGTGDLAYLEAARRLIDETLRQSEPDLVFYNAGVDPHADDRLGLLTLTDQGLRVRDTLVAEACAKSNVPLVGVLGGGYSKDALAVAHRHTFLVEAMREIA
jgi:acetoin utilization deacetylase AcuC-like enzyme